jgi:hypothetical protein
MATKQILMWCPTAKKWVPTGMAAPSLEGFGTNTSQCSACGKMHSWSGSNAKLED